MKEEYTSREALMQRFDDPPLEYGLYPCWWWDGGQLVTREKLTWQLEQMREVGTFATFFYLRYAGEHPYAPNPAYGSDKFMQLFIHSLKEHKRLGMHAYFSEWTGQYSVETQIARDPQSYAALVGGRLVLHEKTSATTESLKIIIPSGEEVLSATAYRTTPEGLDATSRHDLTPYIKDHQLEWIAPDSGWIATIVTREEHGLDWTNPAVADRWIDSVWGPYLSKMPEYIGNTLSGYVQDELDVLSGDIIVSPSLLERFVENKGYDPHQDLIALFHDIGQRTDKFRCDYYEIMCELLEENIYSRISRWHEDRGMLYGSVAVRGRQDILAETSHFGDLFRLLRWYHFPGNEDPQVEPKVPPRRRFIDAKLSSSAAHIFQRQRAAVCAYWGAGWGMTMEQWFTWTNENYAYGLNLFDPHLAPYTMGAGWYEWVPPAHYFYQPYWEHFRWFSEYVRRLSYMMSQGVHRPDLAILFPTTTIHANWTRGHRYNLAADIAASATYNMADSLYTGGLDFDFIDDKTLSQADIGDGVLCVSGLQFRAVALPPMTTIRIATLQMIKGFFDSGGTILAYGRLPSASAENGRDDPQIRSILDKVFGVPSTDGYDHSVGLGKDQHENFFQESILVNRNVKGGVAIFMPGEQNTGTNASAIDLPTVLASVIPPDVSTIESTADANQVLTPVTELYHSHQKVGDLELYYLYNPRSVTRSMDLVFRVLGEPEMWDARTGKVRSYHRFKPQDDSTLVHIDMEPHEAIILSFNPIQGRPAVISDNLDEVTHIITHVDGIEVHGVSSGKGKKWAQVSLEGRELRGEVKAMDPPEPVVLNGHWNFELKPTMDNRWGDYRYPASPTLLGAEARRFKYAEQCGIAGTELDWHTKNLDDGNWAQYTFSFGPYWHEIGPFKNSLEPPGLLQSLLKGDLDLDEVYDADGQAFRWRRYSFSNLYGHESVDVHQREWGGLQGVSDHFIVFEKIEGGSDACRYLATTVESERQGTWNLMIGGAEKLAFRAWVNGQEVLSADTDAPDNLESETPLLPQFQQAPTETNSKARSDTKAAVVLNKGHNKLLIRLIQPAGKRVWAHAAFVNPDTNLSVDQPPIPRLSWFTEPTGLIHDILPSEGSHIGWYRFEAPSGLRAMVLSLDALDVMCWVNGKQLPVRDGRVELESPIHEISQVVLRIQQRPGCYAGAAIPEPVSFECAPTFLPLGDWRDFALESYSGSAVYEKDFDIDSEHIGCKVVIDLGEVNTSAEVKINSNVVGVCTGHPNRLDISEHVRLGVNRVEITVCNTLANHYSIGIPSRFVYAGQTASGLIGPVRLEFLTKITLVAKPMNM